MTPLDMNSPNEISQESAQAVNPEQMFRLIETILPFEACLYHQVLPLSVEAQYLNLGMVDLGDETALTYVKQLLGYINCVLVPSPISANLHQAMLSAYLNYADEKVKAQQIFSLPPINTSESISPNIPELPNLPEILHHPEGRFSLERDTFILEEDPDINQHPDAPPLFPVASPLAVPPPPKRSKVVIDRPFPLPVPPPPPVAPPSIVPELKIEAYYLSSPIAVLKELSPRNLLQELLGRALIGGIGRLYLERQEQGGRILWSQSGVLQSVLDHLSVALFKGVIDELKNLAELPLDPIQDTQQIELERLYQKHRILLRVRFMANRYGEEATLQVLRGAALKFYEKKQIDRLGKDALSIAQQLQRKLEQVRTHRPEEIELNPENRSSTETLSELSHVLNTLNETLKRLEE